MQLYSFRNSSDLNRHFVDLITLHLSQAIQQRGKAFMVVSGGQTPKKMFDLLSQSELDWSSVTILLADERKVPPCDDSYNGRLIRTHLLQALAKDAHFIELYPLHEDAETQIAALPTFDVVILGLGRDGHTASLFPCCPNVHEGMNDKSTRATFHAAPKGAPFERVSLTKNRLLNARHHFLHCLGEEKLQVLYKARAGVDPISMPIRAFLHHPNLNLQVMYAPID